MIKMYQSISRIILLVLIGLISTNDTYASHAMGADLTYICGGQNPNGTWTYTLRYSFYRDCTGIPAPSTVNVDYQSSCFPTPLSVNLNPIPNQPTQISPICSSYTSTCNGGTFTGIEEWIYEATVTLPGACADWTFSHTESARNAAITTLLGAGSDNLFVYSVINNTNNICNNSPIFSNRPVPFACQGQGFRFNHGAYDIDGDSLTYQLITPRTGPNASDTVEYLPGYSRFQPLTSSPPMTFNIATGDFFIVPAVSPEVTVIAVLVSEWRNGVLIGQVERDIQVTVINCNNMIPALTGINGIPGPTAYQTQVCAGSQLCFWIRSADADPLNTTTITWDNSIPAATFTTYGGHRDSATFCWTPTFADVSNTPYCFTATVQDDNCPYLGTQVYSYCITVKGVEADAGPDQTIPCGATANLLGTANGGNGTYTYTWNPGAISSQTNNGVPVGTYTFSVTSAGCSDIDSVQVLPGLGVPAASYSFTSNCSGLPVQFTDLSTVNGSTLSTWLWDFGDGTTSNLQNPSHQFTANGTYNVSLTVSTPTNCTNTSVQQVIINTNVPQVSFAANNVCDGFQMTFNDQSGGAGNNAWTWDFDDPTSGANTSNAQNPTHTFTAAGTYDVSLTVSNSSGCSGQTQQTVTVHPNPVINVPNTGICAGAQATLNGPAGFSSYAWDSGQTTQSITVTPAIATNYTLTVTDGNGCIGSATATVNVDAVPIPNAGTAQTICEGTGANLAGSGGNIYTWNPGNLSGANVTVYPSVTTTYTLTVASNAGCSATADVTVNVNPMPTVDAGNPLQICDGETITINATTSAPNIIWTPGNYTTSSITVNPNATTTYTISVSDAIGCSGADTVTLAVYPIPVSAFSSTGSVCEGGIVTYSDQSQIASGSIVSWSWDFGNSLSSNAQNPTTVYTNPGNFNVTLTIQSDGGCESVASFSQTIWATPVADYTHTNVCDGNPISFNDASTISDGSALGYSWDLGDNTTSSNPSLTHQYSGYGSYPARLIVSSVNGCTDTVVKAVNVYALPNAAMNTNYVCDAQNAIILDASTVPQGIITSWLWDLGDQTTTAETNPVHVYSQPGNYNLSLRVTTDQGCLDSTTGFIRIVPPPTVNFLTENACLGFEVDFTDQSMPSTGPIIQYEWNFGDGSMSTLQNPTHTYTSSGFFQVSLTATSDSGCITTLVQPNALEIYAPPIPNFTSNAAQANDITPLVDFLNLSSGSVFNYWNFGDGDTSTEFSPTHMYDSVGVYAVQLIGIDQRGCVDSITLRIEIKPTSNVYIPNAFTPNGDASNDIFRIYTHNVAKVEVSIYDRWGLKIVEWKDLHGGWDGRVGGDPAQADTYVYRVSTTDVNNKQEVFVGHVSLVR